jgi:transcriptional regulator with XRE-family HTH domain
MGSAGFQSGTVEVVIGERLRARRTALGLTQEQLGTAVGLSYQQIQKYENGSNQMTVGRLLLLAASLNVPVAYFLDGLDSEHVAAVQPPSPAGAELVQVLESIRHGPTRGAVADLVRAVAERQL